MYLGRVPLRDIRVRLNAFDWDAAGRGLWQHGVGVLPGALSPEECGAIAALYGEETLFRSVVDMARYRFGNGKYKYFSYPLPPMIEALRTHLYPRLVPIARTWVSALHSKQEFPAEHSDFLNHCHTAGQTRPTPLLLRYGNGDFNCLHQDLYGDIYFPFQVMFLLSAPGEDFTGGEFLLAESAPRAQVAVRVVPAHRGDAVIFTTRYRPVKSHRGFSRIAVKHGVSTVTGGQRVTMGIIFHDAK